MLEDLQLAVRHCKEVLYRHPEGGVDSNKMEHPLWVAMARYGRCSVGRIRPDLLSPALGLAPRA